MNSRVFNTPIFNQKETVVPTLGNLDGIVFITLFKKIVK